MSGSRRGASAARGPVVWVLAAGLLALAGIVGIVRVLARQAGRGEVARALARPDRLAEMRRVDPRLLRYRETARFGAGVRKPRGLAVSPDGLLLVAGDRLISRLKQNGGLLDPIRLESEPGCLAAAKDGTLYAGMRDHVEVYGPDGARRAQWRRAGERSYLTSIAVAPDAVWVADAGERVVLRYDRAGKLLGRIGKRDDARGIPGLLAPSPHLDVAVPPSLPPPAGGAGGRDGLVWVSNPGRHRLEAYAPDGELKRSWGKPSEGIEGFVGCCNPTDFALLPDGRFVTSEKGVPRVKLYGAGGALESVVAPPDVFAASAAGLDLAVDARGRILVLDPVARAVRVFEETGDGRRKTGRAVPGG
ncbi:MAG: hypothetical protein HY321_05415 [Armatimonadetes bacterium]|nr:hypothetical protein [Armatimonadota bacterium]